MAGNVIVTRRSSKDFRVDRVFKDFRDLKDFKDPKDTYDFINTNDFIGTKAIMALEAAQAQRDYQVNENAFGGLRKRGIGFPGTGIAILPRWLIKIVMREEK